MPSPFPGMDPFVEINPRWEVLHGWFIRELARQSMGRARELGCRVDVERSVYGREPTGELVLLGEPDLLAREEPAFYRPEPMGGRGGVGLAEPRAIHEVVLDLFPLGVVLGRVRRLGNNAVDRRELVRWIQRG